MNKQLLILDSSPIRLIKILCRKFGETVQHVFCENVSLSLICSNFYLKTDKNLFEFISVNKRLT